MNWSEANKLALDLFPVSTRSEARAKGHKKYFTGKICKHGHISQRYVSNGICCNCLLTRLRNNVLIRVDKQHAQQVKDYVKEVIEMK